DPPAALPAPATSYPAGDERPVRVGASRFEPAPGPTAKLEGARLAGYETVSLVGIRDPQVLASLDTWLTLLRRVLEDRIRATLDLDAGSYDLALRCYGADAILGPLEDSAGPPREVGLLCKVRAGTQQLATAVAKIANPLLLHLPLPGMTHLPSFAFATSPPEMERGASYEFVLNHVLELEHGTDLFRV